MIEPGQTAYSTRHPLLQFGMLVTATVNDLAKEADALAAVLPLGLVLPKHIKVPVRKERHEQLGGRGP